MGRFPVEVVRMDPQTYAAFRWASSFPGEELREGITTLVEFRVQPVDGGVSVTVLESGFAALDASEQVRLDAITSNSEGWTAQLAGLKERAERVTAS